MEGSLQRHSGPIFDSYRADQPISSSTLSGSDVFGPYSARAWADLSNVNKLCLRCESVPWMLLVDGIERTSLYEPPIQLGTLRSSDHTGCHLCTLVLASLLATRFRRERDGNRFLEEATIVGKTGTPLSPLGVRRTSRRTVKSIAALPPSYTPARAISKMPTGESRGPLEV
jgi:hypothetical protein